MEQANNPLPQTPLKPNEAKNFPKWVWLLLAVVSLLLLLWWINQSRQHQIKAPPAEEVATLSTQTMQALNKYDVVAVKKDDGIYLVPVDKIKENAEKVVLGATRAYAAREEVKIAPKEIEVDKVEGVAIGSNNTIYLLVGEEYSELPGKGRMLEASTIYKTTVSNPSVITKIYSNLEKYPENKTLFATPWSIQAIPRDNENILVFGYGGGSGGSLQKLNVNTGEVVTLGGGTPDISISPSGEMLVALEHSYYECSGSYERIYTSAFSEESKKYLTDDTLSVGTVAWLDDKTLIADATPMNTDQCKDQLPPNNVVKPVDDKGARLYKIGTDGAKETIVYNSSFLRGPKEFRISKYLPLSGSSYVIIVASYYDTKSKETEYNLYLLNHATKEVFTINSDYGGIIATGEIGG